MSICIKCTGNSKHVLIVVPDGFRVIMYLPVNLVAQWPRTHSAVIYSDLRKNIIYPIFMLINSVTVWHLFYISLELIQ